MQRPRTTLILCLVCVLAAIPGARALDWTYFQSVGNNVSISFATVTHTTYTWKFRNDGRNKITFLKFTYTYFDVDSGQSKTDTDYLPGSLKPGEVIGGWAAFTAPTRSQPTIRIVEITRD